LHAIIDSAAVAIPAVKQLVPEIEASTIKYIDDYVAYGFEKFRAAEQKLGDDLIKAEERFVKNGVFAKLGEVIGQAKSVGDQLKYGVVKPTLAIAGLSREVGALIGDGEAAVHALARDVAGQIGEAASQFDIRKCLPSAKLLGAIDLKEVVETLVAGELPDIKTLKLPEQLETRWHWDKKLKDFDGGGLVKFKKSPGCTLTIDTLIVTPVPKLGSPLRPPLLSVTGHITVPGRATGATSFTVELLGMIQVGFGDLGFESKDGRFHLQPDIQDVKFIGPLEFVNKLQEILSKFLKVGFQIFADGDFITAGLNLPLPTIAFGAFSMQDIRLETNVRFPLSEKAMRFEFAFCDKHRPFVLSVCGFAGGGFLSLQLGTDGFRQLEGASGGLYVMAGIYFKIGTNGTEVAGFLRAGGNLDVLGLIHVTVEFYLALSYRKSDSGSELHGTCSITVSIDILFFSVDVSVEMERTIAGSSGGGKQAALTFDGPRFAALQTTRDMLAAAITAPTAAHEEKVPAIKDPPPPTFKDTMSETPGDGKFYLEYLSAFDLRAA
jgi:hypothetical protein